VVAYHRNVQAGSCERNFATVGDIWNAWCHLTDVVASTTDLTSCGIESIRGPERLHSIKTFVSDILSVRTFFLFVIECDNRKYDFIFYE
jgi:hypothetical protein